MRKYISVSFAILLIPAMSFGGGVERIDISPMTLVNLNKGHSGSFMGGAVAADVYFANWVGLRTTLGFTKNRYFPSELDYADANYDLWVSFAPYLQTEIAGRFSPYFAMLGTIAGANRSANFRQPLAGLERAPVRTLSSDFNQSTYFSIGASVGTKLKLAGPISVFGEVSHYFYSNVVDADKYYPGTITAFGRPLDFERNPTYASFGLTYSLDLKKD